MVDAARQRTTQPSEPDKQHEEGPTAEGRPQALGEHEHMPPYSAKRLVTHAFPSRGPQSPRLAALGPASFMRAACDGAWLGRLDSNQGMAESKSAALPLGYAPSRGRTILA
jgi:hypothetical protein